MTANSLPLTFVHIVTHNSQGTIITCLRSVISQFGYTLNSNLLVQVTDNNSDDDTVNAIKLHVIKDGQVLLRENKVNLGFSGAHNQGIAIALERQAAFVLILNPDVRLEENALRHLVTALMFDTRAGMACPRLFRGDALLQCASPRRFDSAGMFITPNLRHFDRGSEALDDNQYNLPEYVFGASGAAVLFRNNFLRDVAHNSNEVFDNKFFAYREDADLSWRAQWLGWKCRYVPEAIGYHARLVLPEIRRKLPAFINALGVRNRFLLQLNNFSFTANYHCVIPSLLRNLLVIAAALTVEKTSRTALLEAWQLAPQALKKRRALFSRKRVSALAVKKWFTYRPYAEKALCFNASVKPIQSICAVVVNFNSGKRLDTCLRHLVTAITELPISLTLTVKVIDNASTDNSVSALQDHYQSLPAVTIECSKTNLGFAGAINSALASCTADAFLVLNPDVEISAPAILSLVQTLSSYASLGIVSPLLQDPPIQDCSGLTQLGFTVRRFPTLGSILSELFFLHRLWPNNPWTSRYLGNDDTFCTQFLTKETPRDTKYPFENPELPLLVEQPAGACMLIRATAFRDLNGFDTNFWPAWFEDVDFCKRMSLTPWQCAIVASATAIHEGGYSKELLPPAQFATIWYVNLLRYWKKHSTAFEYLSLRLLLPLALMFRSVVAYAKAYLPCKGSGGAHNDQRKLAKTLFRLAFRGTTGIPK